LTSGFLELLKAFISALKCGAFGLLKVKSRREHSMSFIQCKIEYEKDKKEQNVKKL